MAYTKKDLEKSLKAFFADNPHCKIEGSRKGFYISKPWNDRTLILWIPEETAVRSKLVRSLNKVIMPPAFSAFYHKKSKTLEVTWTAYKLSSTLKPIAKRSFKFLLDGKTHECSFDEASKDVLNIAKYMMPYTSASETDHRNIVSFFMHENRTGDETPSESRFDKPRTFKISNVNSDEASMTKIATHLNFFMTYFDNKSPQIRIHSPEIDDKETSRDRYLHGKFPKNIAGRNLDSRILSFWKPQQSSTSLMQFLFYYRILEFAASQYVESKIRSKLRRIINNPSIMDNNTDAVAKIVEVVDVKKNDDIPRLKNLIKETVDVDLIWSVISSHKTNFCKETKFEGGYTSSPFLTENCKQEALATGVDKMTDTIRKIRNALSHGRDVESGGVISPSAKNERLLEPWVLLLEIIAGQVILNKDVI